MLPAPPGALALTARGTLNGEFHLVVVNLSAEAAQGRVHLPWDDLRGRAWELHDKLAGSSFEREGDELAGDGLYVGLDPWASHFLALR